MSPAADRGPRHRASRGARGLFTRVRAGGRLLTVVMTVGLALAVIPAGSPVDADGPGPFVEDSNYWRFSPNSAENQGDHQVALYPATPWVTNHFIEIMVPAEDYDTAQWFTGGITDIHSTEITWSGPPGMEAHQGADLWDIYVGCVVGQGTCTDPAGWSVTVSVTFSAQSGECIRNYRPGSPPCPRSLVTVTNTRRYAFIEPPDLSPEARFEYQVVSTDPPTVQFTNWSQGTDPQALTYSWDFGDGTTSTARDPRHTYAEPGEYQVRLEASDQYGTGRYTAPVKVGGSGLEVNSTGDGSAVDVGPRGCDTGGTVGLDNEPECTLRAAIEAANHRGSGTITFDIAGSGVPTIGLSEPLPSLTGAVTIDGNDDEDPGVRVAGGGMEGAILTLDGTEATVRGLVLDGAGVGVRVLRGAAVVEGNVLGADPAGTAAGSLGVGVDVRPTAAPGAVVRDNVSAAFQSVVVLGTDAVVADNRIGVSPSGSALGAPELGVIVVGTGARVEGNVVRAGTVGIVAAEGESQTVTGVVIRGNRVGTSGSGQAFADQGQGIRLDGVADAQVVDNVVAAGSAAGISVTGRAQVVQVDDQVTFIEYVSGQRAVSGLTGRLVTVSGNTVSGTAGGGGSSPRNGIIVWEDASEVTVSGNTVTGQQQAGIEVHGGTGHRIVGNRIGPDGTGSADVGHTGILVDGAPGAVVGADGGGNRVRASTRGIVLDGATTGATVEANELVAVVGDDESQGIAVPETATPVTVRANRVTDFGVGLIVLAAGAKVEVNVVRGGATGISSQGATAVLTDNVVVGTADVGLVSSAADATLEGNLIGTESAGGTVRGNAGRGLVIEAGPATVTGNEVVGSGGDGLVVGPGVVATLRGNRITATGGSPLTVAGPAPETPTIAAAIQTSYEGSVRTSLILTDLPEGEAGTIEVFANPDCAPGEAEEVLGVLKAKDAAATFRVIQLIDRPNDDHFTVTFTDSAGRTSELSACAPIGDHPDGDGDGSPDPLDELIGAEGDPTRAVVVTDDEGLLGIGVAPYNDETGVGGGRLAAVAVVDEPAALPGGVSLPYGTIAFEIDGLEPGGSTVVSLVGLVGDSILGDSYWKYGPQGASGTAGWYDFAFDEATMTGAQLGEVTDVPGFGFRRGFNLMLRDGARGDTDGFVDGRIVDPGGPAVVTDTPTPPTPPTPPTLPTLPAPPVVPGGGGGPTDPPVAPPVDLPVGPPVDPGVPDPSGQEAPIGSDGQAPPSFGPGSGDAPGVTPGAEDRSPSVGAPSGPQTPRELARTGAPHRVPVTVALLLVVAGAAIAGAGRRRSALWRS